jgi:hypothetical protein
MLEKVMHSRRAIAGGVVIVLWTFITFAPCLKNGFVHYDDFNSVVENPLVRGLSWQNLGKIFSDEKNFGCIFPLSTFTYAVEYHFFKLKAWIYHFDNLAIHIFNALLVYILIYLICGRLSMAFMTALFFAINPLSVESVAWISERRDVLFAFFYLWSLIMYVRRFPVFSCFLFVLSLLSKPQAVTLPLAIVAIDFLYARSKFKNVLVEKIPYFVIAAAYLLISVYPHLGLMASANNCNYGFIDKIFLSSYALWLYMIKNFIPFQLSCLYPYPEKAGGYFPLMVYGAPAIVFGSGYLLLKWVKQDRFVIFGFALFFITIAMPISLIWYRWFMCDHYMYLPGIGLFFVFVFMVDQVLRNGNFTVRKTGYLLLGIYIVVLSTVTHQYCRVWENDVTLWSRVIKVFPNASYVGAIAHTNRAYAYFIQNDADKAWPDLNQAIALRPSYLEPYVIRGELYFQRKNYALALKDFNTALLISPDNPTVLSLLEGLKKVLNRQYRN